MPHVAHFAINADDVPRARWFHERVFGWKFSAWGPARLLPDRYRIRSAHDGDRRAPETARAGEGPSDHVSNDNPFSESHFKTLKYCPEFPERFGSLEDGRAFGQVFFTWYNNEHCHSGLGFLTPSAVHYGLADGVHEHRRHVLAAAYAAHPERFVNGTPHPAALPQAVWINPPPNKTTAQDALRSTIVASDDRKDDPIANTYDSSDPLIIGAGATLITAFSLSQCH